MQTNDERFEGGKAYVVCAMSFWVFLETVGSVRIYHQQRLLESIQQLNNKVLNEVRSEIAAKCSHVTPTGLYAYTCMIDPGILWSMFVVDTQAGE